MSRINLLPFNTEFRGETNVKQHFLEHVTRAKNSAQHGKRNEHSVNLEEHIFSAVPERDNDVRTFGDYANDAKDNTESGDKDQDASLLARFRGRKLVGKVLDLASIAPVDGKKPTGYIGVIAQISLQTEADDALMMSGNGTGAATTAQSASASVAAAELAAERRRAEASGVGVAGGIKLDWKKKKPTATAAATPVRRERDDEIDGGDQQQVQQQRLTEPHAVDVTVGDGEPLRADDKAAHRRSVNLGVIAGARSLQPLSTFTEICVFDHDRANLTALNPVLGVPLWFAVADALHGE